MTTFAGNKDSGVLIYPYPMPPQAWHVSEQWRMPYQVADQMHLPVNNPVKVVGPKVNTQPITETPLTRAGYVGHAFKRDYYNRIHILPAVIALGSVLGVQSRAVEVWNAYFEPRDFQALEVTNDSGTALDPVTATAPVIIATLRSLRYVLTVAAAGPATIAASYRFQFDVGDFYLTVTGQRTAIFALPPNWANPVIERLKWLTYVMQSINGKEQRISRRQIPRRTWEFTVDAYLENYQMLDSLLVGWQGRLYAFPIWTEAEYLKDPYTAGATEIYVNTDNTDYHEGGYAIITSGPMKNEAVQIAGLGSGIISLTKPLDRSWAGDAKIAPARIGRLATELEVRKPTGRIAHATVIFDVDDISEETAVPEATTYRGVELVLRKPNRAEDVTVLYKRLQRRSDNDEGVIDVEDNASRNFTVRSYEYLMRNRAAVKQFRQWMHARQGQLKPFWMPVWEMNLDIIKPTTAVDTAITIRANGFNTLLQIDSTRKHIAMLHKNGNWLYRQVLQYGPGDNEDEEMAYLDGNVAYASQPGDWIYVTFIEYAVVNSDEVEIAYLKDDAATARIATRSVIQ